VKAAGSNARPFPEGGTLALMTGILFQGRGLPRYCAKKRQLSRRWETCTPSGPSRTIGA